MELKERLKRIMEQEFGITTAKQLNEAYEKMDMSVLGIFKESKHEEGDIDCNGFSAVCHAS